MELSLRSSYSSQGTQAPKHCGALEQFACKQCSYSSSRPNNLTHCNALARKAMELLLQTVKSVLDSLVVVVDKDEEVVDLLRVEVTENKD